MKDVKEKKTEHRKRRAAGAAFLIGIMLTVTVWEAPGDVGDGDIRNAWGVQSASALDAADDAADTFQSIFPQNVKAASWNWSKIRVSWDCMKGADGYMVFRSASPQGPFRQCYVTDDPGKNWYINTNRPSGKTYWYKVRAFQYKDGGSQKPVAKVYSRYSPADSAHARPGKVKITGLSSEGWIHRTFHLTWKPVSGASGYQISMKEKGAQKFTFCGNFPGTEASVDIPDKTKEYVLRVRAYRNAGGKKVYGLFSAETSYQFDWDENMLLEEGTSWLQNNYPNLQQKAVLDDGTKRTPANASWSAAWPLRACRYEPWEEVKAELHRTLAEDLDQYGYLPDSVCLYAGKGAEPNYVHLYMLH